MANRSIVKIPRKYLEQSVDVVDQLTNLGYKACNQLRDCNNNWALRGLIKARIENLGKNGRRDKRKQKSSRDAKRMCRMAEPTNPRARISATQQARSPSADDVIFVGMTPDLQSDDSPDFEINETSYSETMDSPILASEIPQERSFERGRTIFDSVGPESNYVGVLSSEDVEPLSEPPVPSEDDDLEEVLPRPRSLRKNPPRTESEKIFFENEAPQAKRRKLLHNRELLNEKSQRFAAEKARKQDIERKRAQIATEVPLVHTVECAPGFQWHIDISNPFPTEHSEYTFEWPQKSMAKFCRSRKHLISLLIE
ncbi:hypothetical protein K3495_g13537 [Podosphaera aphanis]|nr:hypothetical protein K3495_g13537 [Podosphaera aphanis]